MSGDYFAFQGQRVAFPEMSDDPLARVLHMEFMERFWEIYSRLDPRSRIILEGDFGLSGERMTQGQLAERLGVCPSRVGELKKRAMDDMRRGLVVYLVADA